MSSRKRDFPVASIRFPARFDDGFGDVVRIAHFKLGKGPCGKVVADLAVEFGKLSLRITQSHADGTVIDFLYFYSQLTGRIEIRYD